MLMTTTAAAGPAHADPLDGGGVGDDVAFTWPDLGLPDEITLLAANATQDFTVPVPTGFSLRRLRGVIHAPEDFDAGFVEISDREGVVLATIDLPAVIPSQAVVPFDLDIAAARVVDDAATLSFTVREGLAEQRCGLAQEVTLSDLSTVLGGNEPAPTTIATFFPPILQRVTIYAPVDADDAERQAVLTLASSIARTHRAPSTAITVVNQQRGAAPPRAPQFTRAIVVESGDAAIEVVNADRSDVYLKVTGRGDQLTDQVSLLTDELQSLAQTPTARVDQAGSDSTAVPDEVTFGQLGMEGEVEVLRTANLPVGVDRAALGADRVDALQVHLLASHTPVAPVDSASLMVSVDGQAVFTTPLGENGRVDATFDVPAQLLDQRIVFEFDLTFSPRQLCTPTTAPVAFQLDPGSTLTMQRGGAPIGGFDAVPSEFYPEFLVAIDGSAPDQLDYAARVVAAVARLTSTPLLPRVVDVTSAAESDTGALIVANAATVGQTSLQPPIGGESSAVQVDLNTQLRADITGGFGSIQAFADEPRDRTVVLVTTNAAWSLVDPLFTYVDQLPDGWSSLDGNVLAAGPDGAVTDLSIESSAEAPLPDAPSRPIWPVIGLAVVIVAAVGALLWLLRRRRTSSA